MDTALPETLQGHRADSCSADSLQAPISVQRENGESSCAHDSKLEKKVSSEVEEAELTIEKSAAALHILEKLQTLPWCRIDTSFKSTLFPYFAHNLIQVTREWLNWEGEGVTQHLAQHFEALETAFAQISANRN